MGRLLKILGWLVAGFIALFALAAIALYLFFDPNDFREDISAAVAERTGRELVIEGDISLDLFPWLAVEMGRTSLGDAPGFGDEPIASFESAKFSARLMPALLSQELIIGAAEFDSLRLNLKVNRNGRKNWTDLVPDEAEDAGDEGAAESGDININRVEITNATMSYNDAETGDVYAIDRMDVSVGRFKDDGSPFPFDGNLHFKIQPSGFSGEVALNTVLAVDAEKGTFVFSDVDIEGTIEGVAPHPTHMTLSTGQIEVLGKTNRVAIQPLELAVLEMTMTADVAPFSYEGKVAMQAAIAIEEFSPRSMMALFDVEPPVTADPNALSSVSIAGNAKLGERSVALTDATIKLDESTFTGTMAVPRVASLAYQFDLVGDSIDLARYMEPSDEGGGDTGDDAGTTEIPVELIKPLNARGTLKLAKATLGNIVFENIDLGLNSKDGTLRIFPASAQLFGGSYNGDVRINVSNAVPRLSVDEKIEGVNVGNLAEAMFGQENVTGTIAGAFKLSGSGADMAAVQKNLSGQMSFDLKDGTYEGTDVWYEIRRARALLKGEQAPQPTLPAKTEFSSVRATGNVRDGVMRNDDLFAELPHMRLTGNGTVDLAAATVDYNLSARILERPEFLEDATAEELDEFTEAVIPLRITGPIASPSVKPNVEELLRERVKEEIKERFEDKLEDKLKDLFGQ